jgi:hypothetical protein
MMIISEPVESEGSFMLKYQQALEARLLSAKLMWS